MRSIMRLALGLTAFTMVGPLEAAAPALSYNGSTLSLTAENQTFAQIMGLLQQQTGLQYELPGELSGVRLPLVEIKNLSVKDALLKVLEGSNYDYILVAEPNQPGQVRRLLVTGRSSKVTAAAGAFRGNRGPIEDPFGGGVETNFEDNSNVQPPEPPPNAVQPGQNPPVQGFNPQPGVQPVPGNQNPPQPGTVFPQQQGQPQPQGLQPFNPFGNQNRRSPY